MWCVAELNQEYIERMEDVLATYEKPLTGEEPVVCEDEKAVSLHQEVREPQGMEVGRVARRDSEYKRCGTANIFCAVEAKTGKHFTKVTEKRSAWEWAMFMKGIADYYPQAQTIHLVVDNLNIHRRKALVDCYGEAQGEVSLFSHNYPVRALVAVIFGIILPVAFCLWVLAYVWVTHPERAKSSVWYLRSITLVEILKDLLARLRFLARPFFIRVKR